MKTFGLFTCIAALVCLFTPAMSYSHDMPRGAAGFEKSETCKTCHAAIYDEWSRSMHAVSSALKDKAHAALHGKYAGAMKAAGKTPDYHCSNCHTPMADDLKGLSSGQKQLDGSDWREAEGVGCAFCHRAVSVVEGEMMNSFVINKNEGYSVSVPSGIAPHKTSPSVLFTGGRMCMGCHSHMLNASGASICVMKEEGQASMGVRPPASMADCQSCHMAKVDGRPAEGSKKTSHFSHLMPGGHSPEQISKAVTLDAGIETGKDGSKTLVVGLTNVIAHSFPAAMPMRMAFLKVVFKDRAGNPVWSNFRENPMEDKKAVFIKVFKAGDKVNVPAWAAEGTAFDTRLKAGEKRTLTYPVSIDGVSSIDVVLIYRLFPQPAIEMMGIPKDGINDKNFVAAQKTVDAAAPK
jgi:hypothetical protein